MSGGYTARGGPRSGHEDRPDRPLAGRMAALLDSGSRPPRRLRFEADPTANDQRSWAAVLAALPAGAPVAFDPGWTTVRRFADLTRARITFATRAHQRSSHRSADHSRRTSAFALPIRKLPLGAHASAALARRFRRSGNGSSPSGNGVADIDCLDMALPPATLAPRALFILGPSKRVDGRAVTVAPSVLLDSTSDPAIDDIARGQRHLRDGLS